MPVTFRRFIDGADEQCDTDHDLESITGVRYLHATNGGDHAGNFHGRDVLAASEASLEIR